MRGAIEAGWRRDKRRERVAAEYHRAEIADAFRELVVGAPVEQVAMLHGEDVAAEAERQLHRHRVRDKSSRKRQV